MPPLLPRPTAAARSLRQISPLRSARRPFAIGRPPTFALDPRVRPGDKVTVSLSGGVDSSVALALLAQHDLDLDAVFMRNWSVGEEDDRLQGCEWEKDWEDVRRVCAHVGGVPARMVDLSKDYWLDVFEPSLDQWAQGVTPNPDVLCNREIKFGKLMERVLPEGEPGFIATGHYAQIFMGPEGDVQLHTAPDAVKDQSYFLSAVSSAALSRTLFPLGHLHKSAVKQFARDFGLHTAERRESMGICFVGNKQGGGFPERFLSKYIPPSPGPVLTTSGELFDTHHGLHTYTLGQKFRKQSLKQGERWYVCAKDKGRGALVVARGADNPLLRSRAFTTHSWHWVARSPPAELFTPEGLEATVKVMSSVPAVPARLRVLSNGGVRVTFLPSSATPKQGHVLTPGQICAAYVGTRCLGGGTIGERKWVWENGDGTGGWAEEGEEGG